MEHRVHDDRKPARDHPRVSRKHRRRSIDESSIETIPNVYWNRSKEGEREREGGREGDVFVSTEFAVNFDDDILFALL